MLRVINADRQANGLPPVAWDVTAAAAGAVHAEAMADQAFFSHWSPDGFGPDLRYSRVGGRDAVMENIYTFAYRFSDGSAAPIDDFAALVRQAQAALMQSPGHRRNILTPTHTHVGVGFAYNPSTGSFYLAQEFLGRYVVVDALPATAQVGDTIVVSGQLLPGATEPLVNVTYEPLPSPMSIEELNATGSYQRDATIYASSQPILAENGIFQATVVLDNAGRA
ncbi:MAG: CAP domain-containing protein, partial [Chloroflexia bacterium]|nr:CAP domain-containing protein [Chloroflexia bacterium]